HSLLTERYTVSCALLVSSLFLIPAASHQYLHSFPTRRSSDLHGPPGRRATEEGGAHPRRARRLVSPSPRFWRGARHMARGGPLSDRKSTRLNSSHVKISYAVFCLKKKKTSE